MNIVLTGASSGLGAALARDYAAPGTHLTLIGRNADRLGAVAADCRTRGGTVTTLILDITDAARTEAALSAADDRHPTDLLIACAGIAAARETPEDARRITDTNVIGLLNTLQPLVPRMAARGRGQIGVVSSLAGFRALGGPAAYAASKAFARVYAEALRGRLAGQGVGVSAICPGFIDTPMIDPRTRATQRLVPAARAARLIRRGLAANAARISFPAAMAVQVWWLATAPLVWTDRRIRARWRAAQRGGSGGLG